MVEWANMKKDERLKMLMGGRRQSTKRVEQDKLFSKKSKKLVFVLRDEQPAKSELLKIKSYKEVTR
jgi:hypothetical protein